MMYKLDIKPMSVNTAYTGKRYKTDAYRAYFKLVSYSLKKFILPKPPLSVYYEFGFSNEASDIDNPVKLFQDILQKKYNFNDKDVYKMVVEKHIVPKGKEYIKFEIKSLNG